MIDWRPISEFGTKDGSGQYLFFCDEGLIHCGIASNEIVYADGDRYAINLLRITHFAEFNLPS